MELKTKKLEVILVNYEDLDKFINHHYSNLQTGFEFITDEEMSSDSEKLIDVTGKVTRYKKNLIKAGEVSYMTSTYLNDLCKKGVIQAGKYLIQVSW